MNDNSPNKGLGGWLILIGIGVVFSPIRMVYFLATIILPIFTNGTWEALTNPESISYTPYWESLIIFELIFNIAMLIWSGYLVYLFFTKHYRFPLMYILIASATVIFIVVDELACAAIFSDQSLFDSNGLKVLIRSLFALIIWGLYLYKSERSRLTFVNYRDGMTSDNDVILDN
jgi:hypothetical protein